MARTKDILWDAERLAQFANVSGQREAERFRTKNDDFFPPNFWKRAVPPLPDDPGRGMPGERGADMSVMGLLSNLGSLPLWFRFVHKLRAAWQSGFPPDVCVNLISLAAPVTKVWPYQRAVMFLSNEPWRARFCGQCGRGFVADKPATRYCSGKCSAGARQITRAVSWKKHGEKWRARYQKKTSSERTKNRVSKTGPR